MADDKIELKVESPVPGPEHLNSWFALYLPKNLDLSESFDHLVWHIEFRRKCMNQGFDNLIELLKQTRDTALKDMEAKKQDATPDPDHRDPKE